MRRSPIVIFWKTLSRQNLEIGAKSGEELQRMADKI
jgi:hypothetical protein